MSRDFRSCRRTYVAAPRRELRPAFCVAIRHCARNFTRLALAVGFSHRQELYELLRAKRVPATALTVARLERIADAIGFPRTEIFLDEGKDA